MGVPFAVESWIWFGAGTFIVICRLLSHPINSGSFRKTRLLIDDWLMLVAVASYTAFIVTINKEVNYSSNLIAPGEDVNTFTQEDIDQRVYGSKLTVVVEQLQCLTVWLLKACILLLYLRLTDGLPVNIVFKALLAYVAVSFLIMEVLYFAVWCRPFHNYWAIPPPSKQCSAATNHLITNAVLNISSDLIMLIVAFSIFYRSRLPWDRKLILSCVFGLGIFVILCAVLNKYYSFAHPYGTQWTYWYVRESSTTLIIANIPFMWTILRHIFKLNAFHHERPKMVAYHSQRSARGRGRTHQHSGAGGQKPNMTLNTTNTTKSMNGAYSADSSMVEGEPSSPISIRHPSAALGKGQKVASWKTQGFYGREEFDALAIEPWDYGNEELIAADSVTVSTDRGSAGHSPRMTHSRRLRDEEAQYAMQEGNSLKYHDFMIMKEEDTIQETDLDHGKETDLDHGNETDLNHGKDVIPEKVAESVG